MGGQKWYVGISVCGIKQNALRIPKYIMMGYAIVVYVRCIWGGRGYIVHVATVGSGGVTTRGMSMIRLYNKCTVVLACVQNIIPANIMGCMMGGVDAAYVLCIYNMINYDVLVVSVNCAESHERKAGVIGKSGKGVGYND